MPVWLFNCHIYFTLSYLYSPWCFHITCAQFEISKYHFVFQPWLRSAFCRSHTEASSANIVFWEGVRRHCLSAVPPSSTPLSAACGSDTPIMPDGCPRHFAHTVQQEQKTHSLGWSGDLNSSKLKRLFLVSSRHSLACHYLSIILS